MQVRKGPYHYSVYIFFCYGKRFFFLRISGDISCLNFIYPVPLADENVPILKKARR